MKFGKEESLRKSQQISLILRLRLDPDPAFLGDLDTVENLLGPHHLSKISTGLYRVAHIRTLTS